MPAHAHGQVPKQLFYHIYIPTCLCRCMHGMEHVHAMCAGVQVGVENAVMPTRILSSPSLCAQDHLSGLSPMLMVACLLITSGDSGVSLAGSSVAKFCGQSCMRDSHARSAYRLASFRTPSTTYTCNTHSSCTASRHQELYFTSMRVKSSRLNAQWPPPHRRATANHSHFTSWQLHRTSQPALLRTCSFSPCPLALLMAASAQRQLQQLSPGITQERLLHSSRLLLWRIQRPLRCPHWCSDVVIGCGGHTIQCGPSPKHEEDVYSKHSEWRFTPREGLH